ncbi:hypothetical protein OF829_15980 [Sphingomonas sp. LB-2]|uniref:surface-adhesin E family protein n=1 Tax=Sphingomonas caeni TaxID=2984949 RepID=UPI00223254E0|nr:surface-adhesin E family protein [Sphingomonas caeni]MCW3848736.1 hypothetical protein [Sphingomonas caeni]
MILAALLALAAPVSAATAENWVLVTTAPNGVAIYIDKDGLERNGDTVIATERHDYSGTNDARYSEMRVRTAYNCAAHTRQVKSATVTPAGGGAKQEMTFSDSESPVEAVRPDTISASIFAQACG